MQLNQHERAKVVQTALVKFLASPTAMLLPGDVRIALAELATLVRELVTDVQTLKGGNE